MPKNKRRRSAKRAAARIASGGPPRDLDSRAEGAAVGEPGAEPDGASTGAGPVLSVRLERWIVLGLLLLCAVNMMAAAARNTAVCDELGAHIPAGYLYWTSGQYSGGIDNFPLGQLWIALPVKLLGLDYELFSEQHLLLFRLPVIVLGLVLMALVWVFARRLFGADAGAAALLVASLSPNLLAHATLASLDLPTTCAVFAAVFLLYRYAESPSTGRLAVAAAAVAVAMVVKIQSILLLPLAALALGLAAVLRGRRNRAATIWMVASWLLIPLAIVVVVNLVYLRIPLIDGGLLPAGYIDAFRAKLAQGSGGHFAYLFGRYSSSGWWYYFPVAILFKTPVPALLLVVIGLARRHRVETVLFVLLPIVLFLGAGMASRVNIGLRHVLPIYPFLFVVAGAGAQRLLVRGWRGILLGILVAAQAVQAVWIQPHHLSYFNVLAGGSTNGHRVLIDSNYDWGQNDRFLARHVARSGLEYQIDPDPSRPASGPILVNANALYGVLNGGPEAYRWLRDESPTDRIAYSWFEFRAPERPEADRELEWQRLDRLGGHLEWLRRDPAFADPELRVSLAKTLAVVTLYGPAFEEIRAVLDEDPGDEGAARLGGELIVRHKLGVLRYRDMEYLTGFRDPPRAEQLEPVELVTLSRDSKVAEQMSTLYTELGSARFYARDLAGAFQATRMAIELDTSNAVARDNLGQLEEIVRRLRLEP